MRLLEAAVDSMADRSEVELPQLVVRVLRGSLIESQLDGLDISENHSRRRRRGGS